MALEQTQTPVTYKVSSGSVLLYLSEWRIFGKLVISFEAHPYTLVHVANGYNRSN